MGWEIYPDGVTELLLKLHADYDLPPIYITENGMANADTIVDGEVPDEARIDFVLRHLKAINDARRRRGRAGLFPVEPARHFEWNRATPSASASSTSITKPRSAP